MSNLGFASQKEIEMLHSDINVANTRIHNNQENKERFEKEIQEATLKQQERKTKKNLKKNYKKKKKN